MLYMRHIPYYKYPEGQAPNKVVINLATGQMTLATGAGAPVVQPLTIRSVEGLYEKKDWDSTFIGDDGDNFLLGDTMFGGAGNDTLVGGAVADGGDGVDTWRLEYLRSNYQLARVGPGDFVASSAVGSAPIGRASNVERILFSDQAVAFGDRAIEVAKIAFALWSKDIAPATTLFGKGVDWYDHGHSFDEAVRYALSFFADKSDAQIAAQLVANVPAAAAAHTPAELLALMNSHGGGLDGRAYATTVMANDAVNLHNIDLAGFNDAGITCSLTWGIEHLFVLPVRLG